MNKLRTIYSGIGLVVGLVLLLSTSVTAVTVSGYFLNFGAHAADLPGGGSVPSGVLLDGAWLTNSNQKFAVKNGVYQGIAQGSDNFVMTTVLANATLGWSLEGDMTIQDVCNPSCGGNGYGMQVFSFSIQKQTTNSTIVYSAPFCGITGYVPYTTSIGTVSSHFVVVATPPSTVTIAQSGAPNGGCSGSSSSFVSTGYFNWGTQLFASQDDTRFIASTVNWIWNPNDGHTFNLTVGNKTASEFDQGLKDFASGLGFKTPASQTFFTLLAIGLSEVAMAFFTGFFGEGKWRLWAIHGVASTVGVICVLLGYTQFWIVLVAMVLATTVVSGGRETINTFKALAKAGVKAATERIRARSGTVPEGADAEVMGGSVEEVEERADKTEEDKEVQEESDDIQESIEEEESEIDDDGSEDSP